MNKYLILLFMLTTIFSKDIILWDLGVSILSDQENITVIKPLISDTQIIPEYNKNINIPKFNILTSNLSENHIIKVLYCSDRYAELVQYLNDKNETLDDQHLLVYADASYRLGNYEEAVNTLSIISDDYPLDEKYFLFALYNKKSGNIKIATKYLNDLITEYPNSEYYRLAKLQVRTLK
tara:strand:- start:148 stop:684 length:537 start_codon:yes stop_codon:yes gene_type:complete